MRQYEHILEDLLDEQYQFEEHWIQKMHMKDGALRKSLKAKKGKKIPMEKLNKASHSQDPTTRRRATLALKFRAMAAARKRG